MEGMSRIARVINVAPDALESSGAANARAARAPIISTCSAIASAGSSATSAELAIAAPSNAQLVSQLAAQNKRKEKARIAARARRSQEANIIMEMAVELHITQEKIRRIDKATIVKLAIDYIKAFEILCKYHRNQQNNHPERSLKLANSPSSISQQQKTIRVQMNNIDICSRRANMSRASYTGSDSCASELCAGTPDCTCIGLNDIHDNDTNQPVCDFQSSPIQSVRPFSVVSQNQRVAATTKPLNAKTTNVKQTAKSNLRPISIKPTVTTTPTTPTTTTNFTAANTNANANINNNYYPAPTLNTRSIFAPKTEDMDSHFLIIDQGRDGRSSIVLKPDTEILDDDDLTHLAPQAGDVSISLEVETLEGIVLDTGLFGGNIDGASSPPLKKAAPIMMERTKDLIDNSYCYFSSLGSVD